ncbi:MAG: RHS repeat protein [Proteobacteria bacterium]|nr:RHS repeat protein [Pseudomonadota bacterium]
MGSSGSQTGFRSVGSSADSGHHDSGFTHGSFVPPPRLRTARGDRARRAAEILILASTFAAAIAWADAYTYDALGRLTSATNDSGVTTYYCYDKAGNRTYIGPTPCP